ncbi:hypothetical protein IAU60_005045 [Kwoniella sp. DSM 27419]
MNESRAGIQLSYRPITAEQTVPLRKIALWPSVPAQGQLDKSYDFATDTIHLGAFLAHSHDTTLGDPYLPSSQQPESQQPIGIITFARRPYSSSAGQLPSGISSEQVRSQYQLHKFAIHPSLQGYGLGRTFLAHSLEELKRSDPSGQTAGNLLLHLDAREPQIPFYRKCGMQVLDPIVFGKKSPTGEGDEIPHVKMGRLL